MFAPVPVALLIALVLGLAWRASGTRAFIILAFFWASYAVYEYLMYARVLCSGECNIRVDLLLFYPALLVGTIWVSTSAASRFLKRKRGTEGDA